MNHGPHHNRSKQAGFTLIEVLCVLAVIGVMAVAIGSMRTSPEMVERLRVKQEAQYVSSALRAARTTAIANGLPVRMDWYQSGSETGFTTYVEGATKESQPPYHRFPAGLKSEWSSRGVIFQPDGSTDTSLSIVLASSTSAGLIELRSASGQVNVTIKE